MSEPVGDFRTERLTQDYPNTIAATRSSAGT